MLLDPGLCGAIGTHVVREITPGPQHNFNVVEETGSRKLFGHNVIPSGTGAGQYCRRALESPLGDEPARHFYRASQKVSDRRFIAENSLINLNSAQSDRIAPSRLSRKHLLQLFVVPNSRTSAFDAQFKQHAQPLTDIGEAGA